METATWTAIGLLAATSVGSLFFLGSRIDALSGRIEAQGAALNACIDALSARIDTLAASMADHIGRHAG
jgi:hypothetical protein